MTRGQGDSVLCSCVLVVGGVVAVAVDDDLTIRRCNDVVVAAVAINRRNDATMRCRCCCRCCR